MKNKNNIKIYIRLGKEKSLTLYISRHKGWIIKYKQSSLSKSKTTV